jgi:hypothetical protein
LLAYQRISIWLIDAANDFTTAVDSLHNGHRQPARICQTVGWRAE